MNISQADIVIENIKFVANNMWQVYINKCGDLLLKDCTFKAVELLVTSESTVMVNCKFEKYFSISIQFSTNDLLITHCKFSIYVAVINLNVNVVFQANISDSNFHGGLLISLTNEPGQVHITNCEFKDNYGTSIDLLNTDRTIITNSTITNNTGWYLIKIRWNDVLEVSNCSFINNTSDTGVFRVTYSSRANIFKSKLIDNDFGGTISIANAAVVFINESSFNNNRGGGILIHQSNTRWSIVVIANCEFTANVGRSLGGAIISINVNSVIITNSSFEYNTAGDGAAIHIRNSSCEMVNCLFKKNYALDKRTGATIAINYNEYATVFFKGIILTNNYGSGTINLFRSRLSIERASFKNNGPGKFNVTQGRGCIYAFNSRVDITGPVTISGNIGGTIRAIQSQIYINSTENTVISNNTASSGGGDNVERE